MAREKNEAAPARRSLRYAGEQTPEICASAVAWNGLELRYVREQTPEIRLVAARQNGLALEYADAQTPDLCMEAVRQDGGALRYVQDKTFALCREAVKNAPDALTYLFPDGTKSIDNSVANLERNVTALMRENDFGAEDCLQILHIAMPSDERGRFPAYADLETLTRECERSVAEQEELTRDALTRDINLAREDADGLRFVDETGYTRRQRQELYYAAVQACGNALEYVPARDQTPDLCMEAVKNAPSALRFVKKQTPTLCMEAVARDGAALEFVKNQSPELRTTAVRRTPAAIKYVKNQTEALCMEAVERDGMVIRFVKNQSPALCAAAVAQNAWALAFVKTQTPELCMTAVARDGRILGYVKTQSPDLCMTAVKQNGEALKYALRQSPELCMEAVKNSALAFRYISEENRTPAVCLAAVRNNGLLVAQMGNQTPELCREAVKNAPTALRFVVNQTPDVCLEAIRRNGYAIEHVRAQTPELCMEAVRNRGDALRYVRDKSPELCLAAVRNDRNAVYCLFPEEAQAGVVNDVQNLERNAKRLMNERRFAAKDAFAVMTNSLSDADKTRCKEFLSRQPRDYLPKLYERLEREAQAAERPSENYAEQPPASRDREPSARIFLEQFTRDLPSEAFYACPDARLKRERYFEHLKLAQDAGFYPPVFSVDRAERSLAVADKNAAAGAENLLNPFSPEDVEKMKAAARVGVLFGNPADKQRHLAFMRKNLPEVYKIAAQSLARQERRARPLVVGDTRSQEQTPARKAAAPAYGR